MCKVLSRDLWLGHVKDVRKSYMSNGCAEGATGDYIYVPGTVRGSEMRVDWQAQVREERNSDGSGGW